MAGGPLVMVSNAVFCNSQFSQRNETTTDLMLLLAFAKKCEIISGGEAKRRTSLCCGDRCILPFINCMNILQFIVYSHESAHE